MAFVHLHVHSEYSLLDGACRVGEMAAYAAQMGQTALAVTDHGVMYGAVAFYRACQAAGIHPIIGCEVYVAPRSRTQTEHALDSAYTHLILLCRNEQGYHNLCRLVSLGFTEGFYIKPRIDWESLHRYADGLICLSGCLAGDIPRKIVAGDYAAARAKAEELDALFGRGYFYLELQDHGIPEEKKAAAGLRRIADETGIPLVVTNDAHYLRREDARSQDILLCIQTGRTLADPDRMKFQGSEMYLKSEEEMRALFPDCPEACDNTVKIAQMCAFDFEFGHYHLPEFPLPFGQTDSFSYLSHLCREGLARRYPHDDGTAARQLDYELSVIRQMGFVDYFLIVWDFVNYAREKGIPVGPGRGSAAGSVVSYTLHITDVDPIRYSLYFERFLNPERVTMPDIDMDFCVRRRGEVIDYVTRKYGADRVAQIVTFGTLQAKQAVRDVARVLDIPYSTADAVSKAIPQALNMTLDTALGVSKPLKKMYDEDPQIRGLIDTARTLEGMPRHASTHAAGVVISSRPLTDFVPLSVNDNVPVCQFVMTTLEELGLLKMDFLGLRNLTVLEDAAEMVRRTDPGFRTEDIPVDDPETFAMLTAGRTIGVFQLESAGMTGVCVGLRPRSIEDITAIIALYRPGPMDSIPHFLECAADPGKVVYRHPLLEPILSVTYGCIVYQEQVIEIFRRLGGYSLGQADNIRRAMSKKKHAVIDAERETFLHGDPARNIPGCAANGVPEDVGSAIYDEIVSFASYAFNKAHAVSYAIVSYRTAWMKCHRPQEYMAALLTSVLNESARIAGYIAECRALNISLLPPDVNESDADFTAAGGSIRFGLAAVKNVGRGFVQRLMNERAAGGHFTSFESFCRRLYGRDLNRKPLESLIRAGAFDSLGYKRRALLQILDAVLDGVKHEGSRNIDGQMDLFSFGSDSDMPGDTIPIPQVDDFPPAELMQMEKELTGLYLSGHPMQQWRGRLKQLQTVNLGDILAEYENPAGPSRYRDGDYVLVAGMITAMRTRTTKKSTLMRYITLEDDGGSMELIAFQRVLDACDDFLIENTPVCCFGRISVRDEKEPQLMLSDVRPLSAFTDAETAAELREEMTGSAFRRGRPAASAASAARGEQYRRTPPAPSRPAREPPKEQKLFIRLATRDERMIARVELLLTMFPGQQKVVLFFSDTREALTKPGLIHPALVDELREEFGAANVIVTGSDANSDRS